MKGMRVKLLVVQGQPRGKHMIFPRGNYFFGRGDECHVRPNSAMVSRQHCLLRVTADAVFLRDLGSRNGTLVNGVLLSSEQQLQPGDQIQIGPLVFELHLETDSGSTAASGIVLEPPQPAGPESLNDIQLPNLPAPPNGKEDTKENHGKILPPDV